jgi:uncharacterized protein (DUF1015 family)
MADVSPFRGWRYDLAQVGDLSDVICPPYDVIDARMQDNLYKRHPCNVIRLELNRAEPTDADPAAKYQRAADYWKRWRSDGVLLQEHDDALYVYHQQFSWEGREYNRRGFLARIRLEEFGAGQIFPHEQTLSGPKADRLALFHACKANLSPVFGLYPDETGDVQQRLDDACLALTALEAQDALGVRNRMWVVTNPAEVNAVRSAMREKPIFIADGHHRYETALNYRRELQAKGLLDENAAPNFVLMHCVGMQDPGLQILPTHRLVSGPPTVTTQELRTALSDHFELELMGLGEQAARDTWELIAADGGQSVFGFGSAAAGGWLFARLTNAAPMDQLAADHSAAWRGLAVSRLHKLVLEKLLVERFAGAAPKCEYVHRLDEVTAAMKQGGCQVGCLVPPATIEHVRDIASRRETMPPKSTYFYPKLLTGMVFHALQ